jgi:hypothetical protein
VPRAGSSEESFRNLKRLRPRFPLPERMTAIWWPKYIKTLCNTGVWDSLVRRIAASGYQDSLEQCEAVLQQLLDLERQEVANAISGKGFQTIWQRSRP